MDLARGLLKKSHMASRRVGSALGLVLGGLVLMGGCGGTLSGRDDGGTGPVEKTAMELFDETVVPILKGRCSACHAGTAADPPKFLGSAGEGGYYAALTGGSLVNYAAPASSALLNKGAHAGGGPAFTAGEKSTISAWLSKENEERSGGGTADAGAPDAGP